MMGLPGILGVLLLGTAPAPVRSVDDVVALVAAKTPEAQVVASIRGSGLYLPLSAEKAVKLFFSGVPVAVLQAMADTAGGPYPKLSSSGGELELLYDGFRIVGRRGASGPVLALSGFASDGSRLKPPVEPAPEPVRSVAHEEREAPVRYQAPPEPEPPRVVYVRSEPEPAPRDSFRVWPQPGWGPAPGYVSYSQVPPGSLVTGQVVMPLGYPYGYPSPYYGHGGYGTYTPGCSSTWGPGYSWVGTGGYVSYSYQGRITSGSERRPPRRPPPRVRVDRIGR